jgi:hypothetical protein
MGFGDWMKVVDTLSTLAGAAGKMRNPGAVEPSAGAGGPLGQLETRLAGVVVAALKEAFDRDRARMDLERSQMESERRRAEEALRAELRRQASERALGQLRMIAVMAIATWMLSAALGVWLPGMRRGAAPVLMGLGWLLSIGALGCVFAAWQRISTWSADPNAGGDAPLPGAAAAAPWLLLGSMALTCAALLMALLTK